MKEYIIVFAFRHRHRNRLLLLELEAATKTLFLWNFQSELFLYLLCSHPKLAALRGAASSVDLSEQRLLFLEN